MLVISEHSEKMKALITIGILISLSLPSAGQDIKVVDFDDLEPWLALKNDTVYVVNFWATWCKPCTEEIPDFVKANRKFEDRNYKMLFVSLDMPDSIDGRLRSFISNNKISSEVIVLDDPDFNSWINKVDKSWKGSIPATLIYYPGYRKFVEGTLDYEKIVKYVEPGLK